MALKRGREAVGKGVACGQRRVRGPQQVVDKGNIRATFTVAYVMLPRRANAEFIPLGYPAKQRCSFYEAGVSA